MTLKQIHSMFEIGQTWDEINTYCPAMSGPRTLAEKLTTQLVWNVPRKTERGWMKIPKASQVIEARDGFLHYRLFSSEKEVMNRRPGSIDATITLIRQERA